MTTQATHSYDAALADARKATETAQALADDYRHKLDATREALHEALETIDMLYKIKREQADAYDHELITLRTDRDLLMSELGEANQGLMVGEGL